MTKELQAYLELLASEKPEYASGASTLMNQARILVRLGDLPESFVTQTNDEIACGNIKLLASEGSLVIGDKQLTLTKIETDFLAALMKNNGIPMNRRQLSVAVYGTVYSSHRVTDVHIARIRKKTKEFFGEPVPIETIRNYGYKFAASEENVFPKLSSDIA